MLGIRKMKKADDVIEKKLDTIVDLLKHLVALELARSGVRQTVIAKQVKMATAKVGKLLVGVKRD